MSIGTNRRTVSVFLPEHTRYQAGATGTSFARILRFATKLFDQFHPNLSANEWGYLYDSLENSGADEEWDADKVVAQVVRAHAVKGTAKKWSGQPESFISKLTTKLSAMSYPDIQCLIHTAWWAWYRRPVTGEWWTIEYRMRREGEIEARKGECD